MFIPDPDPDFFIYPGSRGQKNTESRIRISNTGKWENQLRTLPCQHNTRTSQSVRDHFFWNYGEIIGGFSGSVVFFSWWEVFFSELYPRVHPIHSDSMASNKKKSCISIINKNIFDLKLSPLFREFLCCNAWREWDYRGGQPVAGAQEEGSQVKYICLKAKGLKIPPLTLYSLLFAVQTSVADPGSKIRCLILLCGSRSGTGIFLTLDPGWKNSDQESSKNIPDPQRWFKL
jgi:hypothetical protein